jgi:hypothetical protein
MSTFLPPDDIVALTGRKVKSKQIDALKRMGIAFWVNALGRPVVTVVAVEGRREIAPPQPKQWVMPRTGKNGQTANS